MIDAWSAWTPLWLRSSLQVFFSPFSYKHRKAKRRDRMEKEIAFVGFLAKTMSYCLFAESSTPLYLVKISWGFAALYEFQLVQSWRRVFGLPPISFNNIPDDDITLGFSFICPLKKDAETVEGRNILWLVCQINVIFFST